jgi:hypothetical protein
MITVLSRAPVRWVFDAPCGQRFTSRADRTSADRSLPSFGRQPVRYEVDYLSVSRRRLLIWKTLTIPHFIVLSVLLLFVLVPIFAWFGHPLHRRHRRVSFLVPGGSGRPCWGVLDVLTDQFPPFSLSPAAGLARKDTVVRRSQETRLLALWRRHASSPCPARPTKCA